MLDKNAFRVLEIIISMTVEGETTVLEKTEILRQFGDGLDESELDTIMELLELNDMISVRYSDGNLLGVTPRPKGRVACEKRAKGSVLADVIEKNIETIPFDFKKLAIVTGVSAFLGGFVAAIIAFIIAKFS